MNDTTEDLIALTDVWEEVGEAVSFDSEDSAQSLTEEYEFSDTEDTGPDTSTGMLELLIVI